MKWCPVFALLMFSVVSTGCSFNRFTPTGTATYPPTPPGDVQFVTTLPAGAVQIGEVRAMGTGNQRSDAKDEAKSVARALAAKNGATYLLITKEQEIPGNSIVYRIWAVAGR